MKIQKILGLGVSIVIGLAAAGCHHGAYAPKNTNRYDIENKEPFVLLGERVQRSVTCSGIQKRINADGRLEVAANIRNREDRRIQVQVSCEFKDEQGFVVDSTPFQSFILGSLAQESYRVTAMNEKAKGFTIRVQEAK